ncbi:HNH endonuclease [Peribacillus frigoritolerans]|uniref:HNH endonuclease n=1 Tax=Peribacillus frigoritolerans TaxID=450367 RepID=UPI003D34C9E7
MIHIKRTETPICLIKNRISDGHLETLRAIQHYESGNTTEYPFKVYKKVKKDLKKMFFGKCAYCESKIDHNQNTQIEHYRPKGYVEGEPKNSPGYYWLAADWDNLILACEKCNGKGNKGNHFPLKDLNNRVKHYRGNIDIEEPLLINPCKEEHPEDHLSFYITGEFTGEVDWITDEGRESIKIYGLHRYELITERAEHLYDIDTLLICLKELIEKYDQNQSIKTETAIRRVIKNLKRKEHESSQFAGMTRQYLSLQLYDILSDIEDF